MRRRLKNFMRSVVRAGHYPILLPHFRIMPGGLQPIYGPFRPLDQRTLEALRLCDGTRTLGRVAREVGVSRSSLIQQHEDGVLLLWRTSCSPSCVLRGEGGATHHLVPAPR